MRELQRRVENGELLSDRENDKLDRFLSESADTIPEGQRVVHVPRRCYIAGPMRGYPFFNFPAFDAKRNELCRDGWDPISPADLDRAAGIDPLKWSEERLTAHDAIGWETYIPEPGESKLDIKEIIQRDFKAILSLDPECGEKIVLLDNWGDSTGANAERALARWIGLTIDYPNFITESGPHHA